MFHGHVVEDKTCGVSKGMCPASKSPYTQRQVQAEVHADPEEEEEEELPRRSRRERKKPDFLLPLNFKILVKKKKKNCDIAHIFHLPSSPSLNFKILVKQEN